MPHKKICHELWNCSSKYREKRIRTAKQTPKQHNLSLRNSILDRNIQVNSRADQRTHERPPMQ